MAAFLLSSIKYPNLMGSEQHCSRSELIAFEPFRLTSGCMRNTEMNGKNISLLWAVSFISTFCLFSLKLDCWLGCLHWVSCSYYMGYGIYLTLSLHCCTIQFKVIPIIYSDFCFQIWKMRVLDKIRGQELKFLQSGPLGEHSSRGWYSYCSLYKWKILSYCCPLEMCLFRALSMGKPGY